MQKQPPKMKANRPLPSSFEVLLVAPLLMLSACEMLKTQTPSKTTQTEYLDVDYRKFVSGIYVDELKDKYVKIDCAFSSMMAGRLPGGYSSERYIAFQAVSPQGRSMVSPETLTVVLPKDLADIVFSLHHLDPIQVRGRAVATINRRATGGDVFRNLILQGDLIQKIDKGFFSFACG